MQEWNFLIEKNVIICKYRNTSFSKWEKFKKRMNFSMNQDTMEKTSCTDHEKIDTKLIDV